MKIVSLQGIEEFLLPMDPVSPDRKAANREEIKNIISGLAKLSPRQRSCLVLSVFEGLSMNEISKTIGIRVGTVKRYIFEARQALSKCLKKDGRNDGK